MTGKVAKWKWTPFFLNQRYWILILKPYILKEFQDILRSFLLWIKKITQNKEGKKRKINVKKRAADERIKNTTDKFIYYTTKECSFMHKKKKTKMKSFYLF